MWRAEIERAESLADGPPGQPADGRSVQLIVSLFAARAEGAVPVLVDLYWTKEEGPALARRLLDHAGVKDSNWTVARGVVLLTARILEERGNRWSRRNRYPDGYVYRTDTTWAEGAWKTQAAVLRDLYGHLFHADPLWVSRLQRTDEVERISRTIYDDHSFAEMPVLADALEEAGCADADVLAHCRKPGEHARGCWVIDAILERC